MDSDVIKVQGDGVGREVVAAGRWLLQGDGSGREVVAAGSRCMNPCRVEDRKHSIEKWGTERAKRP